MGAATLWLAGSDPAAPHRPPPTARALPAPLMAAPTATPPAARRFSPEHAERSVEDPCPQCGEGVRRGLVRCWNCGAFMREELAARYAEMSRGRSEVTFQPLPELEAGGADDGGKAGGKAVRRSSAGDDLGDFELAGTFGEEADEGAGDFELSGQFAAPRDADAAEKKAKAAADGGDEDSSVFKMADAPDAPEGSETADAPAGDGTAADETAADGGQGDGEKKAAPPEPDVPHSEATGGDALLEIARQEEKRLMKRKGLVVTDEAFLLRCPAGHPIKVKRKHAGKLGRCPHPGCGLRYLVPDEPPGDFNAGSDTAEIPAAGAKDPLAAGAFHRWIDGVALHAVEIAKVKPKAGSEAKSGTPADLALSADALLVLILKGKAGAFGLGGEKPGALREKAREHLAKVDARLTDLPCEHLVISGENLGELAVKYPSEYEHEGLFGGAPVFGEGKIVVRLPDLGGDGPARFVALTLSQFRAFASALTQFGFVEDFGAGTPVPLTDDAQTHTGHYTDAPVAELPRPDLYRADPAFEVEVTGYRCGNCGLIVSEDGRKKEKLGGSNGKGLAKAKCPKCKETFGDNPLYGLKSAPAGRGSGE